jgi:hypothetical protein
LKWKGMVSLIDQLHETSWAATLVLSMMKHMIVKYVYCR